VSQGYLGGIFGPLLLFGIGAGFSYLPMSSTILSGVSGDDYGSASGMYQAMQQIGGALGLAILVSIAGGHSHATIKVLPASALQAGAALVILAFILTTVAFTGRVLITHSGDRTPRRESLPREGGAVTSAALGCSRVSQPGLLSCLVRYR
jgi:hypothetical protein